MHLDLTAIKAIEPKRQNNEAPLVQNPLRC